MVQQLRVGVVCFAASLLLTAAPAQAQDFFLQGDCGPRGVRGDPELACVDDTCTLAANLSIDGELYAEEITFSGDLEVGVEGTFETLAVDVLTVDRSVWLPECPRGYERDWSVMDFVLCYHEEVPGVRDEMVKVGDIWVDRYEASVWEHSSCSGTQYGIGADWTAGFPYHGQFTIPLYACSVSGVTPAGVTTWFQAQAACTASGKRLMTNAEWQAAVIGTRDPGASDGFLGICRTDGAGRRDTGDGGHCVSAWGAEDMIGHLWEWTSDWYGQGGDDDDGSQPEDYFGDGWWNVDRAQTQGLAGNTPDFPAAARRGGSWTSGTEAGAFALDLRVSPSFAGDGTVGFRCARGF